MPRLDLDWAETTLYVQVRAYDLFFGLPISTIINLITASTNIQVCQASESPADPAYPVGHPIPPHDNDVVYTCADVLKPQVEVEEKSSSCSPHSLRSKSQLFLLFFPHSTSESALRFPTPYPTYTPLMATIPDDNKGTPPMITTPDDNHVLHPEWWNFGGGPDQTFPSHNPIIFIQQLLCLIGFGCVNLEIVWRKCHSPKWREFPEGMSKRLKHINLVVRLP